MFKYTYPALKALLQEKLKILQLVTLSLNNLMVFAV